MEAKKTLIMRIYEILNLYSDEEHPLTQQQIIEKLHFDYDIDCERKAVGRNLSYLKEMGYDIESGPHGVYLATRLLEKSELRLLIDSVLCSRNINAAHSKALIDKLIAIGGRDFKSHVKHVYSVKDWGKSENKAFFLNIELADEAIDRGKKIAFDYNKTGADKRLHKTSAHMASPYQMLLHNQRYYLMLHDDKYGKICFYRMDKITNMQILDDDTLPIKNVPGYEKGINYGRIATGLPYMYGDLPVPIKLRCSEGMADALADWFGNDFTVCDANDGYFTATIVASEQATLFWALQYSRSVEVLSPPTLRSTVMSTLEAALSKYRNN